LILYQLTPL